MKLFCWEIAGAGTKNSPLKSTATQSNSNWYSFRVLSSKISYKLQRHFILNPFTVFWLVTSLKNLRWACADIYFFMSCVFLFYSKNMTEISNCFTAYNKIIFYDFFGCKKVQSECLNILNDQAKLFQKLWNFLLTESRNVIFGFDLETLPWAARPQQSFHMEQLIFFRCCCIRIRKC